MAERVSIFSVLFALCFSVALSRTLPPQTPRTATLDVSASIQKTLEVLFSPESTQLDQAFSPPSSSLSFRLHSRSTFNSGTPYEAVTAPLIRNSKLDTFYYIDLTGLSVSGELLSIPPSSLRLDGTGDGGVIVDSGTAVTRLQSKAYASLRDAFANGTKSLPSASSVALFDTCFDLSSMKSVEVPTVSLRFSNGKELALPAKNYVIPVDSNGTFCFAFAPTESSLSIIGNVQQQGTRVSFDLAKSTVGFSPNSC
ncbi:hypothetical protein C3L33_17057, partial [Rhododendron williamsianum]